MVNMRAEMLENMFKNMFFRYFLPQKFGRLLKITYFCTL